MRESMTVEKCIIAFLLPIYAATRWYEQTRVVPGAWPLLMLLRECAIAVALLHSARTARLWADGIRAPAHAWLKLAVPPLAVAAAASLLDACIHGAVTGLAWHDLYVFATRGALSVFRTAAVVLLCLAIARSYWSALAILAVLVVVSGASGVILAQAAFRRGDLIWSDVFRYGPPTGFLAFTLFLFWRQRRNIAGHQAPQIDSG